MIKSLNMKWGKREKQCQQEIHNRSKEKINILDILRGISMDLTIRCAKPSDALFLTSISFGAKRYWNYPEEYLEIWHDELTITEEYIEENMVFVAQKKDTIIGYCSVTEVKEDYWRGETFIKAGHWLDHIFIRPAYIRNGIGRELIDALVEYCRENNIEVLNILSDPNANGFYDKIGATYIQDMPSNIEGREVCLFEFAVPQKAANELEEDELLSKINELVANRNQGIEEQMQERDIQIATISREESVALLTEVGQLELEDLEEELSIDWNLDEEEEEESIENIYEEEEESVESIYEEEAGEPVESIYQKKEEEPVESIYEEKAEEPVESIYQKKVEESIEKVYEGEVEEIEEEISQEECDEEKAEVSVESSIDTGEAEEDDIFEVFRFNKQAFQMELEDLEKKRMRLEQEVLEQKLHELDKDMEEDSLYSVSEEDEEDDYEQDYEEDEDDYEQDYNEEDDDDESNLHEYNEASPIANFEFTTPIGYKFECEEEEDTQETSKVGVENTKDILDWQDDDKNEEIVESLENRDIWDRQEDEIEKLEDHEGEEQGVKEILESSQKIVFVEEVEEVIADEVHELEVESTEERENIEEVEESEQYVETLLMMEEQNQQVASEEIAEVVYELAEEEMAFMQVVAETSEAYSIVDTEVLYNSNRLEPDNNEEVQHILERAAEEEEKREYIHQQEGYVNADRGMHVKTEKEKMLEGEQYIAWGDEIVTDRRKARRILNAFNHTDPEDKKQTTVLLKELLGSAGEYIHIEPDFKCNYGYNIHIGDNFYAGYNCVILDNAKVTIGDNCIMSPHVGIYTLAYPISAKKRMAGYEYAHPITIGDNVWIGGGTIINPGITIGNDVVIAPGSVIVSDVPDGVIVGGNPAQIIKEIDE